MIQDNLCNRVFFSALLKERCPIAYKGLTEVLDKYNVPWSLLEGTNDIWCRDYMPIHTFPNRFVAYDYNPDYLQHSKKDRSSITDGSAVCDSLGLNCESSLRHVKLDGGNIVKADGRVIMTSKIFEENCIDDYIWFIDLLQRTLFSKLVILPWDSNEEFGHSDGICRYIGRDRVLMTNYADFDSRMAERHSSCSQVQLGIYQLAADRASADSSEVRHPRRPPSL